VAHLCVPHRATHGHSTRIGSGYGRKSNTLRKEMTISSALASNKTPFELGIVLYPRVTLLDFAGPQCSLGLHGNTHLLWKTLEPVKTDLGISVLPTSTFANSRKDLDVLFVPGGMRAADAIKDDEILNFLAEAAKTVRRVTSVCTGSLLLGAAGLLHGYKAATHWSYYEALAATGAEPVHARVVADRNRLTGAGITAGIDFGLTLLAELRGEVVAKATQLAMEYDPQPPFQTESPKSAGPELIKIVHQMLHGSPKNCVDAVRRAREARPTSV
jgi:cyclohexyl-isocyanide hydratase